MKQLEFIPIYNGEYGVVPQNTVSEDTDDEDDKVEKFDGQNMLCWVVTLLCVGYLICACLR